MKDYDRLQQLWENHWVLHLYGCHGNQHDALQHFGGVHQLLEDVHIGNNLNIAKLIFCQILRRSWRSRSKD